MQKKAEGNSRKDKKQGAKVDLFGFEEDAGNVEEGKD